LQKEETIKARKIGQKTDCKIQIVNRNTSGMADSGLPRSGAVEGTDDRFKEKKKQK
jgi:hypothetical protein